MPLARVWNDNTQTYTEKYQDAVISIPPKQFIEMEYSDAVQFASAYIPIHRDGIGNFKNPKMIRVEKIGMTAEPEKISPKCHLCKEEFQTERELVIHSDLKHSDQIIRKKN